MNFTPHIYRGQPSVFDLTTETLEMRVIELEREIERLNDAVTMIMMGRMK